LNEATLSQRLEVRSRHVGGRTEWLLVAALTLSTFGLLGGDRIVLIGDVVGLMIVLAVTLWRGVPYGQSNLIGACVYVLLLLYVITSFGANFPGWYPALLGIRKTLPPWVFLFCGCVWPGNAERLVRRLVLLLLWACIVSLVLHNFAPSIEGGIARAANKYTGLYAGSPRLQGVFAGPFHAALAALLLILVSLGLPSVFPDRLLRLAAASVGLLVLLQASVRAGWIAAFAGLLMLFALRPSGRLATRLPRAIAVIGALALAFAAQAQSLAFQSNRALESLTHWQTDSRLLARFDTWREARALIEARPLIGWGPGSASDTLDRYFGGLTHVTPHNMLLTYAVEVGLLGAVAVAMILVVVGRMLFQSARSSHLSAVGFALLFGFVVFGATGTAVDAAPVSWIVLCIVGLGASRAGAVGNNAAANSTTHPSDGL
jgi:O-antigen ligase